MESLFPFEDETEKQTSKFSEQKKSTLGSSIAPLANRTSLTTREMGSKERDCGKVCVLLSRWMCICSAHPHATTSNINAV